VTISFRAFYEKTNLVANELKPGDRIEDCNPDCKHYKSEGEVTAVKQIKGKGRNIVGNKVEYRCDNSGTNWKKGDRLEKTEIQLKKIKK
jgi:hypothetical protein